MPLAETSLIEHCSDENVPALTVHRLVQAAMRARLAERQSTILDQVTKLLVQAFPEGAYADATVWLRCAELLPHVLALFKHCTAENVLPEAGGRLFHAAASYLHARDSFAAAEPLYRAAIRITEIIHGRDDRRHLNALSTLASLLQDTGRTGEAEHIYREVIDVQRRTLGGGHPDLAVSLNNLGTLLHAEGRVVEAEPLLRQALGIKQSALGPDHPGVANSLANLGNLLRGLDRREEAELLCRQALQIHERALGRNHANVAASMLNLAVDLSEMGRRGEAEPLLRDAVAIWSATLGADHPTTARASIIWRNCCWLRRNRRMHCRMRNPRCEATRPCFHKSIPGGAIRLAPAPTHSVHSAVTPKQLGCSNATTVRSTLTRSGPPLAFMGDLSAPARGIAQQTSLGMTKRVAPVRTSNSSSAVFTAQIFFGSEKLSTLTIARISPACDAAATELTRRLLQRGDAHRQ